MYHIEELKILTLYFIATELLTLKSFSKRFHQTVVSKFKHLQKNGK